MDTVEILYIILSVCVIVITVTIVWLANETMKLVKSLRHSSEDVEFMTKEMKEKVLLVSEALDRAGTAATNIVSLVEDAIETVKEKRDQLSSSIGLVAGVGDYFKKKKVEHEEKEEDQEPKHDKRVEKESADEDKKAEDLIDELGEETKKKEDKAKSDKETKKADDIEDAKPIKKEVAEKK